MWDSPFSRFSQRHFFEGKVQQGLLGVEVADDISIERGSQLSPRQFPRFGDVRRIEVSDHSSGHTCSLVPGLRVDRAEVNSWIGFSRPAYSTVVRSVVDDDRLGFQIFCVRRSRGSHPICSREVQGVSRGSRPVIPCRFRPFHVPSNPSFRSKSGIVPPASDIAASWLEVVLLHHVMAKSGCPSHQPLSHHIPWCTPLASFGWIHSQRLPSS